jgi:predicted nucleic acid-binding Zn ribbon protein
MHPAQQAATDFLTRRDREQRRHYARKPKKIADVLAQLITARAYGRIQADADFTNAWQKAAGATIAKYTRPGRLRRGTLEVTAANSMIIQELAFQKQQILAQLQTAIPDAKIRDIRFRVGSIA